MGGKGIEVHHGRGIKDGFWNTFHDKGPSRAGVFFYNTLVHGKLSGFIDYYKKEGLLRAVGQTLEDAVGGVNPETVDKAVGAFEDYDWNKRLFLSIDESPAFKRLKFSPPTGNRFVRAAKYTSAFLTSIVGDFGARDNYHPSTHGASVFYNDKALIMKQIAIAKSYDESKHPTARTILGLDGLLLSFGVGILQPLPIGPLRDSWQAPRDVLEKLPQRERAAAHRRLEKEFIFDAVGGAKFILNPVIALLHKFSWDIRESKWVRKLVKDRSIFFRQKKWQELLTGDSDVTVEPPTLSFGTKAATTV
jgi:hypothetical protein